MAGSGIAHQLDRDAQLLERHEPLLGVGHGRAPVLLGVDQQRRRGHVLDIGDGRQAPVQVPLLPWGSAELVLGQPLRVGGAPPTLPVGDGAARSRCGKTVCGGGQPVGHEAAVAPAGDAQTPRIDGGIRLQGGIHAGEIVVAVDDAPLLPGRVLEVVAVPGGAARVGVEDVEARCREHVEGREKGVAVGAVGSPVNLQDHGIVAPGDLVDGPHDPALDLGAVVHRPGDALGGHEGDIGEPVVVEAGGLLFGGAVAGGHVELGRGHRVGGGKRHHAIVPGEREPGQPPVARRHLADLAACRRHGKQVGVASDAGREADLAAVRGPGGRAGLQIPIRREVQGQPAQAAVRPHLLHHDVGLLSACRARQVGDRPAVRRQRRRGLAARVGREAAHRASRDRHRPDVSGVVAVVLVVLALVAREVDAAAIGRPLDCAHVEVQIREPAGRAALGGDYVELRLLAQGEMREQGVDAVALVPYGGNHVAVEAFRVQGGGHRIGRDVHVALVVLIAILLRTPGEGDALAVGRPHRRALHAVDVEDLSTRPIHSQEPDGVGVVAAAGAE